MGTIYAGQMLMNLSLSSKIFTALVTVILILNNQAAFAKSPERLKEAAQFELALVQRIQNLRRDLEKLPQSDKKSELIKETQQMELKTAARWHKLIAQVAQQEADHTIDNVHEEHVSLTNRINHIRNQLSQAALNNIASRVLDDSAGK